MNKGRYNYFTKQNKGDCLVLYGWGTYPSHSVLAGQASKSYIKAFDTEPELDQFLIDNDLEADWSNQWIEPQISLNHLSDEGDY
jgi:hypothetical protein